jgi:putative membrane protein
VIGLGMLIAAGAAGRWVATERAMRRGRPLPLPLIVPLLVFGAVAAAVLALWVFMPT